VEELGTGGVVGTLGAVVTEKGREDTVPEGFTEFTVTVNCWPAGRPVITAYPEALLSSTEYPVTIFPEASLTVYVNDVVPLPPAQPTVKPPGLEICWKEEEGGAIGRV
jgi:hypothetical protein